jgi:serine/threonine-protein kinase
MAVGLDAGRAQMMQPDLARVDALRGDWAMAERRYMALVNDPDPPIMQFGSVVEARLALWRGDLPRVIAAVSRLPLRFRGEGFDLISIVQKWLEHREFDLDAWMANIRTLSNPAAPHRTQLSTFQRVIEACATMKQEEATELSLRAASAFGLLDVMWIECCPVFAPFKQAAWYADIVNEIRVRAASVLAAFRAAR